MNRFETFDTVCNKKILLQGWLGPKPKGTLFFTHGQGEHSDLFHENAAYFVEQGWNVWAWDLPGHGRSEGVRSDIGTQNELAKIICQITNKYKEPNKPLFLMGFSLGGMILSSTLTGPLSQKLNPNGLILIAPALYLGSKVLKVPRATMSMISQFLPFSTPRFLSMDSITSNFKKQEELLADPYYFDRIHSNTYHQLQTEGDYIFKRKTKITIPTFAALAKYDSVVSSSKAKKLLTHKCTQLSTQIYNCQHDILNDTLRSDALEDISNFMNENMR